MVSSIAKRKGKEIETVYPFKKDWIETLCGEAGGQQDFETRALPFPMFASWDDQLEITNLYAHKYICAPVIACLRDILEYYGLETIKNYQLDRFGGAYSYRVIEGTNEYSVHSWGMAFDYCPVYGEYKEPPVMPEPIVTIFKNHGFLWGGDWTDRNTDGTYKFIDGMHFTGVIE